MSQQVIETTKVKEQLQGIFEKEQSKRVMLVCDLAFDFLQTKEEYLELSVPYVIFNQFTPNPLYEDVVKGVKVFREYGCDTIVAVGGGSSLDVAKCIKLYATLEDSEVYLEQEYKENDITLIAIPTTSGTGSESTRYAVIYFEGKKQSVTHESIIPKYAILDYRNLVTLPLYQKKCTMMDALCQSIESWWSVNATKESRVFSKKALSLLVENMDSYLKNEEAGNKNMLVAANYAGQAINITQTTAAHAMSYKLTSLYRIPHGRAVFICLPYIWRLMNANDILPEVFQSIAECLGHVTAEDAVHYLFELNRKVFGGDKVHMDAKDLDLLTDSVNPTRLKNNPMELSREMIYELYEEIVEAYR